MSIELNLNALFGAVLAAAILGTAKMLWNTSVKLAEVSTTVADHGRRIEKVEEKVA